MVYFLKLIKNTSGNWKNLKIGGQIDFLLQMAGKIWWFRNSDRKIRENLPPKNQDFCRVKNFLFELLGTHLVFEYSVLPLRVLPPQHRRYAHEEGDSPDDKNHETDALGCALMDVVYVGDSPVPEIERTSA